MHMQMYPQNSPNVLRVCYLFLVLVMAACQQKPAKKVDVSDIKINFKKVDYYKELYTIDTLNIESGVNSLGNKYPDFSSVFFNELTGFNANNDQEIFLRSVHHFLTYKDYRNLYDTVLKKFPDTQKTDKELESLFKHIAYYYPEEKWGTVYYFISGLNQWSAITVDTLLGIGLDMHLGKDYPYYVSVGLPLYQIEDCEPQFISVNASKTIFKNKFPFTIDNKNLLQMMIYNGLMMTFAEYTLPDASDELLMGYTPQQMKWCRENERMIWSYFKKQNLLYSTNLQQVLRYTMDGPSSTGMPQESPGNIGTWIGWQIVRKYLDENPDEKWPSLPRKKLDAQVFLSKAKYKP